MNKIDAGLPGGEESFVLDFLFILYQKKEKHTVVEPFNLRIYFENFTKQ